MSEYLGNIRKNDFKQALSQRMSKNIYLSV